MKMKKVFLFWTDLAGMRLLGNLMLDETLVMFRMVKRWH